MGNVLSDRYLDDGIPAVKLNKVQEKYLAIFRDKCSAGVYAWKPFQCECGNGTDFEALGEKDRYGLPVRTVICPCCGLVMTNPRMTGESYDRFYESEYPMIYRAINRPDETYFQKRVAYGNGLVDLIEKTQAVGKDVLEIGCAGGGIVKAFTDRGYNGFGVDLSTMYIKYGREKGINLRCCHSGELVKEGRTYDTIILNHVLEHFTDLGKELDIIRKLLRPQGVLFVAVPGIKNLLYSYENDFLLFLQNAHIYHFTKDTLIQVLKWHGFDAVYADEKVQAVFRAGKKDMAVQNFSGDIKVFLRKLEDDRQAKEEAIPLLGQRISSMISDYEAGQVAVYGTGKEAARLLDAIGKAPQIKGFLTKDNIVGGYTGYPVLDINDLQGIRCVIIASYMYRKIIYERIRYLEETGIKIIQMYE